MSISLYSLEMLTDHPPFEGFALDDAPSLLGREDLSEDIVQGYEVSETVREWKPIYFKDRNWVAPKVYGRTPAFQDYSHIVFALPVFSKKACEVLKEFLEPNGELLPLDAPQGEFYFFNVTNILDALDIPNSDVEFWCDPPTTAVDITYFSFKKDVVKNQSIFRFYEDSMMTVVNDEFVKKVRDNNLTGFSFKKIWPLPKGAYWRNYHEENEIINENLKANTVIIVLNFPDKSTKENCEDLISNAQDSLDKTLSVKKIDDKYYGTQEGHDVVGNKYRIFISCPYADELISYISSWLNNINFAQVQLYKKEAEMYNEEVLAVEVEI